MRKPISSYCMLTKEGKTTRILKILLVVKTLQTSDGQCADQTEKHNTFSHSGPLQLWDTPKGLDVRTKNPWRDTAGGGSFL